MKKIIIILLGILIISIGLLVLTKQGYIQDYFQILKEETLTETKKITVNTDNWKIYKNSAFNFQMSYPEDVEYEESFDEYFNMIDFSSVYDESKSIEEEKHFTVYIFEPENDEDSPNIKDTINSIWTYMVYQDSIPELNQVNIGKLEMYTSGPLTDKNGGIYHTFLFNLGKNIYAITFTNEQEDLSPENKQILGTFSLLRD